MCDEWAPNKSFSNSNRHFVVGDVEELSELASYSANVSPHMTELLAVLPDTFDELNSNVRENGGNVIPNPENENYSRRPEWTPMNQ
jgi:ABC-type transporter Mla subunit MlaD